MGSINTGNTLSGNIDSTEKLVEGNADVNMHLPLLVDMRPIKLSIVEGNQSGKLVLRGEFGRAGVPTENKRVYTGKLWEQQISKLKKALKERKVIGECDHPSDGRTSLRRVSHVITDLYLNDDGILIGEAEILPTACGNDLAAMLRAGVPVGVSSRGYGSTIRNDRGEDVVQEDYQLVTFDFVADPADSSAYPQIISEGKQFIFEGRELTMDTEAADMARDKTLAKKWADMILSEDPDAIEEKEKLKQEMISKIAEMKSIIYDEVKKELLNDPNVGGAKVALEQLTKVIKPFIVTESVEAPVSQELNEDVSALQEEVSALQTTLTEKDRVISALKEDITKAGALIKDLGYKNILEGALAGDPDASLIRKAIGDVKKFESVKDLKVSISSVREELEKRKNKEKVLAEKREKMLAVERAQESQLRQQIDQLTEAVGKAVEANKELALKLYSEQQLQGNPRAPKIRGLLESTTVRSQAEINKIIDSFDEPRRDAEQQEQVRSRVRNLTKGGMNSRPLDEETGSRRSTRSNAIENDSFTSVGDFKALSGLGLK